ncbi:HNH endonuclease [compost metagenome]
MPSSNFRKTKSIKSGLASRCNECVSLYRKIYYQANKERIRKYYEENKDRALRYAKECYSKDPEKFSIRNAAYRAANQEAISIHKRKNRAMRAGASGSHTNKDIRFIFDSQKGKCANCHKKLFKTGSNKFHIDHIVPLSKGGSDDKCNIQCLCKECNLKKHAKDPLDWARENGRLL